MEGAVDADTETDGDDDDGDYALDDEVYEASARSEVETAEAPLVSNSTGGGADSTNGDLTETGAGSCAHPMVLDDVHSVNSQQWGRLEQPHSTDTRFQHNNANQQFGSLLSALGRDRSLRSVPSDDDHEMSSDAELHNGNNAADRDYAGVGADIDASRSDELRVSGVPSIAEMLAQRTVVQSRDPPMSAEARDEQLHQFTLLMQHRFLEGYSDDIDYATIDNDATLDYGDEEAVDEQDRYFDQPDTQQLDDEDQPMRDHPVDTTQDYDY
jgi:hypothetical protein